MRRTTFIAISSVLVLTACERAGKLPAEPPAEPVSANEVAAADGYGAEGETVNAVAFWSHPGVNFESLVLAATDKGVAAQKIETGEKISEVLQGPVDAMGVIYSGAGAKAQGYVIAGRPNGYEFYSIDNATGAMTSVMVTSGAPRGGAFCAGRAGESRKLYEISANSISERQIEFMSDGISLGDPKKISSSGGAACHVDDRSGSIITIGEDGAIRRVDPATGESEGIAFATSKVDASALILMTTAEGAAGGAVLTLDGANGVVSAYDLEDGHALGNIRIKSTFDLDAVASAKTIGAGYGNYGGVYRDGVVAVITAGEGAPIRLAPWNGVLDALGLAVGKTVDPRNPQPVAADEVVIDIEPIEL